MLCQRGKCLNLYLSSIYSKWGYQLSEWTKFLQTQHEMECVTAAFHNSSSQKLINSKHVRSAYSLMSMWLIVLLNMMFRPDIDHLTRILVLCGTPAKETVAKITSEEVMALYFV